MEEEHERQHTCRNFHSCSCSDSLCFNGSLKSSVSIREVGSMLSCCCCLFMESLDICTLLIRKAALLSLAFCCKKDQTHVIGLVFPTNEWKQYPWLLLPQNLTQIIFHTFYKGQTTLPCYLRVIHFNTKWIYNYQFIWRTM